jgi:hypothetical protein
MLRTTSDDMECGVMYRCEKYRLICNFFIDCMKVGTDQWEWTKKSVVVEHVGKGVIV